MTLKELVKRLKVEKQKRIVVSGPQFSGTTIGAYILARQLKLKFVNNATFDFVDLKKFVKSSTLIPKYCSPCSEMLHNIHSLPDDVLIVIMSRPIQSIMESQRRLGWRQEAETKRLYRGYHFYDDQKPSIYLQNKYSEMVLARERRIEYLDYDSLSEDKLFIPNKLDRRTFKRGQIFRKKQTPAVKDFTK